MTESEKDQAGLLEVRDQLNKKIKRLQGQIDLEQRKQQEFAQKGQKVSARNSFMMQKQYEKYLEVAHNQLIVIKDTLTKV